MIPCPECGARSQVIDSRPEDQYIRRRRKCPECDARFTTTEAIVERRTGHVNAHPKDCIVLNKRQLQRALHSAAKDMTARILEVAGDING